MCASLGSAAATLCQELKPLSPPERLASNASIFFTPLFGDHTNRAGIGLATIVGNATLAGSWEQVLAAGAGPRETVVIVGSALHDIRIKQKFPGAGATVVGHDIDSLALATYQHRNLCAMAALMDRVRRANDRVSFVWRQSTHSLLTCDGVNV